MKAIPHNYRGIPARMILMHLMDSPLRGVARFIARCRADKPYIAVNPFGKGAPQADVSFLAHAVEDKSDGFIMTARTEKALDVWISDGGFATRESLQEILGLREKLLILGGLSNQIANPRYKLEVTYLVSHFHTDHINEGIFHILPSPFIRVKRVYFPHITAYASDRNHTEIRNGDIGLRTRFMLSQQVYQPQAEMIELPFDTTRTVPFGEGKITLMMPAHDWGAPERLADMARMYGYNDMPPERQRDMQPVQVVNANCVCAKIEFAARSVLLTGDVMKKTFDHSDEPFDQMVAQYAELMRADIVKYPHHGQARNGAWPVVRDLLISSPAAVVVLTGHQGWKHGGKLLSENDVPWVDIREGTLTFTLLPDGTILRTRGPVKKL